MENKSLIIFVDNRQIVIPIEPKSKVLSILISSENTMCNTLDISVDKLGKNTYIHLKKIK